MRAINMQHVGTDDKHQPYFPEIGDYPACYPINNRNSSMRWESCALVIS